MTKLWRTPRITAPCLITLKVFANLVNGVMYCVFTRCYNNMIYIRYHPCILGKISFLKKKLGQCFSMYFTNQLYFPYSEIITCVICLFMHCTNSIWILILQLHVIFHFDVYKFYIFIPWALILDIFSTIHALISLRLALPGMVLWEVCLLCHYHTAM